MSCKCVFDSRPRLNGKLEFAETVTQTEWAGKWNKPVMYYQVIGDCRTMTRKQVSKALNYAMSTWDIEIPIQFKPADWTGAVPDITIEFKGKAEDHYFNESPATLAYAYFPEQGDASGKIVFNNDYMWTFQGKGIEAGKALEKGWIIGTTNPENILRTYSIISVLIHELGHSLGLRHDVSGNNDGTDVMDAYYSGSDRFELSDRDLFRIKSKYGSRIFSRWSHYGRLKRAFSIGKRRLNMFK